MKITEINLFRYKLPLTLPMSFEGKAMPEREGLILEITDEDHSVGFGEIAPLPGFSEERLQEAQRQALDLKDALINRRIPEGVEKLTWHFDTWLKTYKLFPSVRCGFEMAVLDLLARSREVSLHELFGAKHQRSVPLSALIQGTQKQLSREVKNYVHEGVRSFKLKVGSNDTYSDLERIAFVRSILPANAALRIDANQQWDYGAAGSFAKAMEKDLRNGVEYLEEPTKDNLLLGEFFKVTQFPYALDESLRQLPLKTIKELKGVKAFILKPTMLGGFERAMNWARLAQGSGIGAVVSSSFETGVGVRALAQLAAALPEPRSPAGLDTLKWFEKDIYTEGLAIKDGSILTESLSVDKNLMDFRLMEPVKKG